MSRWKKLDNFDAKLEQMTAEELRAELSLWKKRAHELAQPGKKGTMKIVFKVQKVLDQNPATNCRLKKGVDLRRRHNATGLHCY